MPTHPLLFAVAPDGAVLVREGHETLPTRDDLSSLAGIDIGALEGRRCFAASLDVVPDGFRAVPLRRLFGTFDERTWAMAGRAAQLVHFERTHRFCGACGASTMRVEGEHARRCGSCSHLAYPRVTPAVIVLVERPGELLLARGSRHPEGTFSALAGFVEAGETLEETVRREVREEVGVELSDLRYVESQPWPFPHSLMVGFRATWAGGEPCADGVEILEAGWFAKDALPKVPPPPTIARRLIDGWLREQP
jgi:NAD+ diphosphatase